MTVLFINLISMGNFILLSLKKQFFPKVVLYIFCR